MPLKRSWVAAANASDTSFPLNNLPYGVFGSATPRCGVAIGDRILDVTALEAAGAIKFPDGLLLDAPSWNKLMAAGPKVWAALRARLEQVLVEGSADRDLVEPHLIPMADVPLHLPFVVSEYTDFYAGRHHAFNVGTMFRGAENALPPNWLHVPIGYNGRASSVVVSGAPVRRPWGQVKDLDSPVPSFRPSRRFDIELELGAIIGTASNGPVTVAEADEMIFGYVLLNDWSARDIQAWEYQPLGPFQAKATATTISPWIVPKAALEPFRTAAPSREFPLLPHLRDEGQMFYDIDLEVGLAPEGMSETVISRSNSRELYYSAAQQLAHHTSCGCPMRVGDLLGSGTISGATRESRGSLLELSWGGKEPFPLREGALRAFIEDNDTLTLRGAARGEGYTIGFGDCSGQVLPALADPYAR